MPEHEIVQEIQDELRSGILDFVGKYQRRVREMMESAAESRDWDWNSTYDKKRKGIPYGTQPELDEIQRVAATSHKRSMTAQGLIEQLISFIIGEGHTYKVTPRGNESVDKEEINAIRGIIDDYQEAANWLEFQEESTLRYFRDGERLRRLFTTDDEDLPVAVRFTETWEMHNPIEKNLPTSNTQDNNTDEVHDFGVIRQREDARRVVGYWINDERVDANEVQHAKYGVDANDPRGLPMLWVAHQALRRISELSNAIHELAVLQASVGLIVSSETTAASITQKINSMVSRVSAAIHDETTGRPRPGNTIAVAGGEKFEFPAPKVDIANLVEGIRKDQRFIGNLVAMPDWMVSGESTANFSSSVTSEGPFAKRMRREQVRIGTHDVEILWKVIGLVMFRDAPDDEEVSDKLRKLRKRVRIQAVGPLISERTLRDLVEALKAMLGMGIESRRGAAAKVGNDFDRVMKELEQENGEMSLDVLVANLPLDEMGDAEQGGGEGAGSGVFIRRNRPTGRNPSRGNAPDPQRESTRPRV